MTSATTTKSVSAALAKREQKAAKARAEARDKRQAKEAYEAEVHDLRARYADLDPNSAEARDIGEEIKAREQSRIHNTGPLADAYEAAKAPYRPQAPPWRRTSRSIASTDLPKLRRAMTSYRRTCAKPLGRGSRWCGRYLTRRSGSRP